MDLLIKAAEYLDSQEQSHGCTPVRNWKLRSERNCGVKFASIRRVHNELEKTRRAKLKGSLESLKSVVPYARTSTKLTQIRLLQAAEDYIQLLKDENKNCVGCLNNLQAEHLLLKEKLKHLNFTFRVRSHSLSSFESNEESSGDGQLTSRYSSDSESDSLIEVS